MKLRPLLMAALLALPFCAVEAQATQVDITDSNMGLVEIGQYGNIDVATQPSPTVFGTVYDFDKAEGSLNAYDSIRFDYTLEQGSVFDGSVPGGPVVYALANYRFTEAGQTYFGFATSAEPGLVDVNLGFTGEGFAIKPSEALVLVTAGLVDATHGYTIIQNISSSYVQFLSALRSSISGLQVSTTYNMAPVPLPAALPMFGLGLLALTGLRLRRKDGQKAA